MRRLLEAMIVLILVSLLAGVATATTKEQAEAKRSQAMDARDDAEAAGGQAESAMNTADNWYNTATNKRETGSNGCEECGECTGCDLLGAGNDKWGEAYQHDCDGDGFLDFGDAYIGTGDYWFDLEPPYGPDYDTAYSFYDEALTYYNTSKLKYEDAVGYWSTNGPGTPGSTSAAGKYKAAAEFWDP